MPARQIFKKHSGIEDQVSTGTKRTQRSKQAQNYPSRRCASHYSENRGDEKGDVEGESTANDVGREPPKDSAHKHPNIHSNCQSGIKAGMELVLRLCGDDGLNQQD